MALLFPLIRQVNSQDLRIKLLQPLCATTFNVNCRFKSTSKDRANATAGTASSNSSDGSTQASVRKADASFDSFHHSDFTNFAEKYGESALESDDQSVSIGVITVDKVLNDLKEKLYVGNEAKNVQKKTSRKYSIQTPAVSKKKSFLSSHRVVTNYNQEHSNRKTKSQYFVPAPKKIILVDKKQKCSNPSHTTILNKDSDTSTKKVISEKSLLTPDDNQSSSNSSANISAFFEELEANTAKLADKSSDKGNEQSDPLNSFNIRKNCLGIQMLSSTVFNQIFSKATPKDSEEAKEDYERSKLHLQEQGLWDKETSVMPDVDISLPSFVGSDLEQNFYNIAEDQCAPYKELLNTLVGADMPSCPDQWQYTSGWTQYNSDGTFESVAYPKCRALVFDVEVCVREGSHPTLATAVSDKHWYSWCSEHLTFNKDPVTEVSFKDLIPLESILKSDGKIEFEDKSLPRVVVGHNVSYDRIRVCEQYQLDRSALKFVDTMSLHIAVSGLVSEQRSLLMKNKGSDTKVILPWMSVGCENNLNDVYKFYCRTKDDLKKDMRNVFVKGSLDDVRKDFQNLMGYCASDVRATYMVLVKLLPLFFERFPHPVTFSGMLEMGSTFLPVTQNWSKYIDASERKYQMLERLLNEELVRQSQDALKYREKDRYKQDPWLWNLDWSVPKGRVKLLPGYPTWYRKLCARTGEREGTPEPENMSTSLQVVPKLLRLTWNGFPLHFERQYGWGYLKPKFSDIGEVKPRSSAKNDIQPKSDDGVQKEVAFPVDVLYEICSNRKVSIDEALQARETERMDSPDTEEDWELLLLGEQSQSKTEKSKKRELSGGNSDERLIDIGIAGVSFVPLPHKDGPSNRVGNPLAKDFLNKIEDGTLSSYHGDIAKLVLKTSKMLSYWKNNRDRILSQMVVWNDQEISQDTSSFSSDDSEGGHKTGIILPMVVTAGTLTRRAVERTWMTASNAYADRIGSELKAMVEAPPGYKFVGADVDSQELWIAATLGDAYFSCEHGGTALGWMTLQGKKSDGSDMHSRTAALAGISRDHAKVINYGRIYGAGVKFIQRLLKQFNPKLSEYEAQNRAMSLFEATKGKKGWVLNEKGEALAAEIGFPFSGEALSRKEVGKLLRQAAQKNIEGTFDEVVDGPPVWVGGSESHMFNCLEGIARSEAPRTPVLGARMTRALEPQYVDDQFMTSRVNWVVQSSAVDYLHLMLVSMQWLFKKYGISGRFCISIHDEVRYLVAKEDRYRAALALQITNLLTRSLFALRLGFRDLPQSVAFFSSVDIDQVLRKEPHFDCVTPSNPDGLLKGYGIPPGQTCDIEKILQLTGGKLHKAEQEDSSSER